MFRDVFCWGYFIGCVSAQQNAPQPTPNLVKTRKPADVIIGGLSVRLILYRFPGAVRFAVAWAGAFCCAETHPTECILIAI
jgi:hypothetical protein